jgi:hypothetical protein
MAYDRLMSQSPGRAHKEYLGILYLAARETESGVDDALKCLLDQDASISVAGVETFLATQTPSTDITDVTITEVDATVYDCLLEQGETMHGESKASLKDSCSLNEEGVTSDELPMQEGNS